MPKFILCYALVNGIPEEVTEDYASWNCCQCGADVLVEPHAYITFMLQHAAGVHLICDGCAKRAEDAWLN